MQDTAKDLITEREAFPCSNCGAVLRYSPGQDSLRCDYCGFENAIEDDPGAHVQENDLYATLKQLEQTHESQSLAAVQCTSCAATFTLTSGETSQDCPFCGTSIVVTPHQVRQLAPDAVVPFAVNQAQAQALAQKWVSRLFFAPTKFKNFARDEDGLHGMYVPFWTFDAHTDSHYTGQRGDTYTVTVGAGKNRHTQTRTRWRPASGRIQHFFDDVLVWAGRSVPKTIIRRFRRWNLSAARPYRNEFLVGFQAQAYDLPLAEGAEQSKAQMLETIRQLVRRDIGGDKQRIHSLDVAYQGETFKLMLLPIWISALQYRGKAYTFVVNGQTGEVRGDRPLSWLKIGLVALGLMALAALVYGGLELVD